jgi:hypothetical protein
VRELDLSVAADKAEWESYLAPLYDPQASDHNWKAGSGMRDLQTGLELVFEQRANILIWYGRGATVKTYSASGAVHSNRYLTFSAGQVCAEAAAGDPIHGISLHAAADTERVYVLTQGSFLVEADTVPPLIGEDVAAATGGKAVKAVTGDFYSGFSQRGSIIVGGVAFTMVTHSGLLAVHA